MADNVLAMTLRMRNTSVTTARNLKREVKGIGNEAQRMGTKFGKSIKATRTSMGGLMGSLVSLKAIIIATFAYRAIQRFGRFLISLTDLFNQQEEASRALAQALAGWGNYSKAQVSMLKEQAAAMQSKINVDNEEIESMMALLATYGMTATKVKEVIGLTIDFAKAKRMDLKAAVDLIGKAFVGYTGTLSRYGIILEQGLNKEEKYAAALKEISAYIGTAAALSTTYAGKLGIVAKEYDDMKKYLGAIIADSVRYSGLLTMLSEKTTTYTEAVKRYIPALGAAGAVALDALTAKLEKFLTKLEGNEIIGWASTFITSVRTIHNTFSIFFRVVGAGFSHLGLLGKEVAQSIIGIKIALTEGTDAYRKFNKERREEDQSLFEQHKAVVDRMWGGIGEDIKDIAAGGDTLRDVWKGISDDNLLETLTKKYEGVIAAIKDEKQALADTTKNRQQYNNAATDTIKLTESMAQQYGKASRLDKERTKNMLERVSGLTGEDIGSMSKIEHELISKQGVLKEAYKDLYSEFAEKELGSAISEIKIESEIKLTGKAEQMFEVVEKEVAYQKHRNYERIAV